MKFDYTKPARTKESKMPARFLGKLETDNEYCLVYAIKKHNEMEIVGWFDLEGYNPLFGPEYSTLENIPEKKKLEGFVNVYPTSCCAGDVLHITRESADKSALKSRVACLDLSKYGITYEESEGL